MQPVSGFSIVGKPTTGSGDIAEIGSSSFMLEASTGFLRQADAAAARSTLGITLPLSVANGGTGVTTSTGSGDNVLATSPTLIAPVLGTPAAGSVLTNCTGLPLTTGVTGTLLVANGGTGVTASTGTGENVLASTPTLITPILGTPTSGTLTNCTGLPIIDGTTGTLSVARGGTGQTGYTIGDVLFASTSTALSKLADVATGNALISGGVGVAPSYGKIGLNTHVTGTLPVASGGTGLSTITGYVKGTGTSPLSTSATIPVADISGTLPVANGGTNQVSVARGQISKMTSFTAVTVSSTGTYYPITNGGTLDTTVSTNMTLGATSTFSIRNTSGVTRVFRIYASVDATASNDDILGIMLYAGVAGSLSARVETECRAFTNAVNDPAKLVTSWMISLENNEEVAVYVANHSATQNITAQRARIVAQAVL
jgi:hypothetical protein